MPPMPEVAWPTRIIRVRVKNELLVSPNPPIDLGRPSVRPGKGLAWGVSPEGEEGALGAVERAHVEVEGECIFAGP